MTEAEGQVEAIVTDPPYGLEFMGEDWDDAVSLLENIGTKPGMSDPGIGERQSGWPSFMGRTNPKCRNCGSSRRGGSKCECDDPQFDNLEELSRMEAFQVWTAAWARAALSVVKPGGHAVVFGGSRTHHRMMAGLEDGGWEIRDCGTWLYGQGFPKSSDIRKTIERYSDEDGSDWEGFGTALKPAAEYWVLARKPLAESSIYRNVLEHGTGAIAIDACRIPAEERPVMERTDTVVSATAMSGESTGATRTGETHTLGRWPANVALDPEAGEALDRQAPHTEGSGERKIGGPPKQSDHFDQLDGNDRSDAIMSYGDSGGPSRFFYCAKASTSEKPWGDDGAAHPTVKPLDLIRWLVRMVTPPGGTVLDPFGGTGTTAEAAVLEDRGYVIIEREDDYLPLIGRRLERNDAPVQIVTPGEDEPEAEDGPEAEDEPAENPDRYHPLAECEDCPYAYLDRYVPPSEGDGQVAIVGEAPGKTEVKKGVPFVGRSGSLLHALVGQAGLKEELADATVTNVVACRPPENKKPRVAARRACAPRLADELDGKTDVIALGKTASEEMLDRKTSVRDARMGPPEDVADNEPYWTGTKRVLATYHPAAALRRPRRQGDIVGDLRKLTDDPPEWTEPEYVVLDTPAEAVDVLEALPSGDTPLALDIETAGSPDHAIPKAERLRCVGLATRPGRVNVIAEGVLDDPYAKMVFEDVLQVRPVLCHNGKFDLQALDHLGFDVPPLGADTMLAAYCLDERPGGKGLEQLAREVVGAPAWKDEAHGDYGGIAPDVLHRYNARDVSATLQLWGQLLPRLEDEGQVELHDFLCRASDMLADIEARGVRVDLDKLSEADETLSATVDEREEATGRWVDNPRSWQQVQAAFDDLDHPVDDTTKETLGRVAKGDGEPAELARAILDYREAHKLHSTYVSALPDYMVDGRIHTNLKLHGTETGRLSSSDPNLQNQPEPVRDMFVVDDGMTGVYGDLASAELRVIGVESGDQGLLDILNGPRKLHSVLAEEIWGPDFTDDHYRLAKTVVYGVAYGRSAYGMSKGLGIPKAEASRVRNAYLDMVPTMAEWQESIRDRIFAGEPLTTAFGRKLRLPKPNSLMSRYERGSLVRRGLAFVPQSTASDINLAAAVKLYDLGYQLLMLVHDSVWLQVEPERADQAAEDMRRAVREAGREYTDAIPFDIDVEPASPYWK